MSIAFSCPGCGKNYLVADTFAGKRAKCQKCGATCQVPGGAITTAPAPVPPAPYPSPAPAQDWQGSTPAPRSGGRKRGLILAAVAVVGILLLTGASFGVYKIFFAGSSGLGNDLKFMPADTDLIASIRVDDVMASDTYKDLEKQYADIVSETKKMQEELSLAPSDIGQIVVGVPFSDPENTVAVVHTKKAVEAKDLIAKHKDDFNEVKVGNYTVYEQKPKEIFFKVGQQLGGTGQPVVEPVAPPPSKKDKTMAFCVVDSKLVLAGPGVKAALERDKKPEFSEGMQAAMKAADFSKPVVVAVNLKDALAKFSKASKGMGEMNMAMAMMPPGATEGYDAAVLEVSVASDVKIMATVICKDSAKAEEAKKMADASLAQFKNPMMAGMLGLQGEAKAALDSLEVAQSGNKVIATAKFNLVALVKSAEGMAPRPRTGRAVPPMVTNRLPSGPR
jgi:hypothetical protein